MLFYFILQKNMPIGNLLIASLEEAFKCALFYLIKYPYSLLVILDILDIKLCQFLQTKTFFFFIIALPALFTPLTCCIYRLSNKIKRNLYNIWHYIRAILTRKCFHHPHNINIFILKGNIFSIYFSDLFSFIIECKVSPIFR